ncbi:MAG: polysaccharide pyruvyl transferase family protein [Thermosynechococcaceae cyanobacterium]
MRAGLINAYSTHNIGDAAIYCALAEMAQTDVVSAFTDVSSKDIPDIKIFPQLPPCDVYISVGGDIFNNAREYFVTKAFIKNLGQLLAHSQSTFLFGQSIPRSCHSLSFLLLTQILKRLGAVAVRDAQSYQRLQQAGVPVKLSFDAAFALQVSDAGQQIATQHLAELEIDAKRAALISLRTFNSAMYGRGEQQFIHQMIELCQVLKERGHQPVLLLQSQIAEDPDFDVATQICDQVSGVSIFNPFEVKSNLPNWQIVMGALAICHLIVGVRYHTSVLALACGRIPFNLYYSNKGQDLCDRLGIPGCSITNFCPHLYMKEIEKTGDLYFDHNTLREIVKKDFKDCFLKASYT